MSRKKTFNIQPDTSLFSKLGRTGYTIPKALSEIIDNSIDSRVDNKVNVDIYFQIKGDEIIIKDDGYGMNEVELVNALRIGYHNNDKKGIGEYGFGLKAASTFLGKNINIYTKKDNSKEVLKFNYKEDEFLNSNEDWNVEIEFLKENEFFQETNFNLKHGTLIIIKELNVTLYPALASSDISKGRLIPSLKRYYMLALGNILNIKLHIKDKKGEIITYNKKGDIIENTFFTDEEVFDYCNIEPYVFPGLMFKCDFSMKLVTDKKDNMSKKKNVSGWIGVLEPSIVKNSKKNTGIYLNKGFLCTKNSKVVLEREQIGYRFHPENRLITGLIELQDFETTNTKDSFIKNEDWFLLEEVMENLIIKAVKRISVSSYINKIREDLDRIFESQIMNDKSISRTEQCKDVNYDFAFAIEDVQKDLPENLAETIDDFKFKIDTRVWLEYKKKYIKEKNMNERRENIAIIENNIPKNKEKMQEVDNIKSECTKNMMFYKESINENRNDFCVDLKILKLKVIHSFEEMEPDIEYKWSIRKNTISVITNTNHIKFKIYNDKKQLQINHIENSIFEQSLIENKMEITLDYIIFMRKTITKSIMESIDII